MFAALKDIIAIIAAVVVLAYSTGQRDWLWKQITAIRLVALAETRDDWGCPSIFDKTACKSVNPGTRHQ